MVNSLKEDLGLLFRLVVGPFYRENAGLLATIFFICFGFFETVPMAISAHRGIMYEVCRNPLVMLTTLCVWQAYAFKMGMFVLQVLRDPQNECLYVMGLARPWQSRLLWCLVYLPLSLPITVYGAFTVLVGFQAERVEASLLIVVFHLLIILAGSELFSSIQRQAHRRFMSTWKLSVPFSLPLPHYLFYGAHLLQEQKLMLLVSKAISVLLLWGGFYLMRVQGLDVRFGLMCMVAASTAHLNIVRKMREFEDHAMSWRRNMPLRPISLFLSYCLFFSLLLLPELFLVGRQIGVLLTWYEPLLFWAVGIAGLSLYHAMWYKKDMHHEKYMNQVFFAWLLFTFAIQFKLPPLGVSVLLGLYAYWLYGSRYYRDEVGSEGIGNGQ